jgi:hypothetical protein
MATIYDLNEGMELTAGLQGSDACDEAWLTACAIANDRDEAVILDDDDGCWRIDPDGKRESFAWPDADDG